MDEKKSALIGSSSSPELEIKTLLPILLDDASLETVTPSRFRVEMSLSTEERYKKLKNPLRKVTLFEHPDEWPFWINPDTIVFQNVQLNTICSLPLTVTNKDSQSRCLKMIVQNSPYISVTTASEPCFCKIAPGMSNQYHVNCCAIDCRDYKVDLTFVSEDMTVNVPVFVIGPRPILDWPDLIKMESSPVRVENSRTVIVRNLSKVPAVFGTSVSKPFAVTPTEGVLNADQTTTITIKFNAIHVGSYSGQLKILYQTGEKLSIRLEAMAENENIFLDTHHVEFEDTFMSLKTHRTVTLRNNSNHLLQFEWKLFPRMADDEAQWAKLTDTFGNITNIESAKYFNLEYNEIIDGEEHREVCLRILEDELGEYDKNMDLFLYKNTFFQIIPKMGRIWPKATAEFTLLFKPRSAQFYESTAYLEVAGLDERLPLKMRGTGRGPFVRCNVETLDISRIFISTLHTYDVVFENKGDISATIVYLDLPLTFGGNIVCSPPQVKLDAKAFGCFLIEVSSKQPGKFVEELKFKIANSGEIFQFLIKGEVVLPMLGLSFDRLDFGLISFGVPKAKNLELINKSKVPIKFRIYCPDDGVNAPLTCETYVETKADPPRRPKEFHFNPTADIVPPISSLPVEFSVVSNTQRMFYSNVLIEMWNSPDHTLHIPASYLCETGQLRFSPSTLLIRGCFINFEYERMFTLKNVANVMTYFRLFPENYFESKKGIVCTCSIEEGYLMPDQEIMIKIRLLPLVLHEVKLKLFLSVFGANPIKACTITCVVQGPVMTIDPIRLDFGKIPTLETVTASVSLENDSPIPAYVHMKTSSKFCSIDVNYAEIQPEHSIQINVSVRVQMPGRYTDTIQFHIQNGGTPTCDVYCFGVGSCILCEPKLNRVLDLGYILTHISYKKEIRFTNKGNRNHHIIWTRNKINKGVSIFSVFSINPYEFVLEPDETRVCHIEGSSTTPGYIEEDFYCFGTLGKNPHRNMIMSFIASAEFAEPMVEKSKNHLEFRLDVGTDKTHSFLQDDIHITNRSRFAIYVTVTINTPFYLLLSSNNRRLLNAQAKAVVVEEEEGESLNDMENYLNTCADIDEEILSESAFTGVDPMGAVMQRVNTINLKFENDEKLKLTVEFEPDSSKRTCYFKEGQLQIHFKSHSKRESIPVRGEVNYPDIEFEPSSRIEFGNVPPDIKATKTVMLKNISPLVMSYRFEWCGEAFEEKLVSSPVRNSRESFFEETYDMKELELPDSELIVEEEDRCSSSSTSTQLERYYAQKMSNLLYPLVSDFDEIDQDIDIYDVIPTLSCRDEEQKSLDLSPIFGTLLPFECQTISVLFVPKIGRFVDASCNCFVDGGEQRMLHISGSCVQISYDIDVNVIELGLALYFNVCESSFMLTNTSSVDVHFEVEMCDELADSEQMLQPNWLYVEPQNGDLKKDKPAKFTVMYYSGAPGEFRRKFLIKLRHGDKIDIDMMVHGFSIFPQLDINISRASLHTDLELSYRGIASLSQEFLKLLSKQTFHYNEDVSDEEIQNLAANDWEVILQNEDGPSQLDINMAIERSYGLDFAIKNFQLFSNTAVPQNQAAIKYLVLPRCEIDFGVITYDVLSSYTILFESYLNMKTEFVVIHDPRSVVKRGVFFKCEQTSVAARATKAMNIVIQPTKKDYPYPVCIYSIYYIQIINGPRIPIRIRAEISTPNLVVDKQIVKFGKVQCGYCFKRTLILTNNGSISCKFTASVNNMDNHRRSNNGKKRSIYFIKQTSGLVACHESILFEIYFEPRFHGYVKGDLKFLIGNNKEEFTIQLRGYGILPALKINEIFNLFPNVLPYAANVEKLLTIHNDTPVPIEFCFSDFDNEIDESEEIVRVICSVLDTSTLYLPAIRVGENLPDSLIRFYEEVMDDLREKATKMLQPPSEKSINTIDKMDALQKEKSTQAQVPELAGPEFSSEEFETTIQNLIQDMIWSNTKKLDVHPSLKARNPVDEAIQDAKPPTTTMTENNIRDCAILIFHGSPSSDYVWAANKVGLKFGLPVLSIDRLIFDSLAENENLASMKVNDVINEEYSEIASAQDLAQPHDDAIEFVEQKVALILSGKKKKPSKKGSAKSSDKSSAKKSKKGGDKASKAAKKNEKTKTNADSSRSSKAGKGKKLKDTETFMNLSEDLFNEIVKAKLQTLDAVVIESLNSVFLRRPLLALNGVLKGIGNVKYIHFILLTYTFDQYKTFADALVLEQQQEAARSTQARIDKMLSMTAEEYEQLSEEDKLLFKEAVLVERKLKSVERKAALKLRLKQKKEGLKTKKSVKTIPVKNSSKTLSKPVDVVEKKKEKASKKEKKKGKSESKSSKKTGSSKKSKSSKKTRSTEKSSGSKGSKKKKKVKATPEEKIRKKACVTFEEFSMQLFHILEFWNRQLGVCHREYKREAPKNKKTKKHVTKKSDANIPDHGILEGDIGVPIWIYNNVYPEKPVAEEITDCLFKQVLFKEVMDNIRGEVEEDLQEECELYSVVRKPFGQRKKTSSDVFALELVEKVAAESPIIVTISKHDTTPVSKRSFELNDRRKTGSYFSLDEYKSVRNMSGYFHNPEISVSCSRNRCIVPSGGMIDYKIIFNPITCGTFRHKYMLELIGWPSKYTIECEGTADIPTLYIDPDVLFQQCIEKRRPIHEYESNVFFKDLRLFDFGPTLITDCIDLTKTTQFHLVNKSVLKCEVTLILKNKSSFLVQYDTVVVQPNASQFVEVTAKPREAGIFTDQLLLAIEDNPRIEKINLSCKACTLNFKVLPKVVRFNRMVINATETVKITLENRSFITVFWKFCDVGIALKYFKISKLHGYIKPVTGIQVEFTLTPKMVGDIGPFTLFIEVYDELWKCKTPLYTDSVELSAEVITTEVTFDKDIFFGEIKGNQLHTHEYHMTNYGKYPAQFEIKLINKTSTDLSSLFEVQPEKGILNPHVTFIVTFTINAKRNIKIHQLPMFTCTFKDAIYKITNEEIKLMVTASTFFSDFSLCPPKSLEFGYQVVTTEKVMSISLKNTGRFEFRFTIVDYKKMLDQKARLKRARLAGRKSPPQPGSKKSKKTKTDKSKSSKTKADKSTSKGGKSDKSKSGKSKSKKSRKSSKPSKERKVKVQKLDVGPYTLVPSVGTVRPNNSEVIKVTSKPKTLGNFDDFILVHVSDSAPPYTRGVLMKLGVKSVMPEVDFQDFAYIFKELLVLDTMNDLVCKDQVYGNSTFVKSEMKLYFNKVVINAPQSARVKFYNCSIICTRMTWRLTSGGHIFSVTPETINIDPYCAGYFTLFFKPLAIEEYNGAVEFTYDVPAGQQKKTMKVFLGGEGYVPEIKILEPKLDMYLGKYKLAFNPLLLKDFACKNVSFQNVGIMTCKVIVEIRDKEGAFFLFPQEDTVKYMNLWKNFENDFKHTNIVTLKPQEIANIFVKFKPSAEGRYQTVLKIHVVNNPFETFTFIAEGDCFCEYVTLQELPTFTNFKVAAASNHETFACYELDFGYCTPSTLVKKTFKIGNHSPNRVYKFQFSYTDKLLFIPCVGHLKPGAVKDVFATFLSKEPINITKQIVECFVCEIEMETEIGASNTISWDERQSISVWEPTFDYKAVAPSHSKETTTTLFSFPLKSELFMSFVVKASKELMEPEHVVKIETLKKIPILLTCVADYPAYECKVRHLYMQETYLFQSNVESFEVKNISNVPFEISWFITTDDNLEKRSSSSLLTKKKSSNQPRSQSAMHAPSSARNVPRISPNPLLGYEKFVADSSATMSSRASTVSSENCCCSQQCDMFAITPNPATIPPNVTQTFTVEFKPLQVLNYKVHLVSNVKNLSSACEPLEILLRGNSVMPKYHFDLKPSDYMKKRRVAGIKTCGDPDKEDVRVVEFEAIGLKSPVMKKFNIINPTSESFTYTWEAVDSVNKNLSTFNCYTRKGTVEGKALTEAVFSFLPNELGTYEKFYNFVIEKYELSTTFLMVGKAREPCVFFTSPHTTLKNTIVGIEVSDFVCLRNNEAFPLNYHIKRFTTYSEDRQQKIILKPLASLLPANSETNIMVLYNPTKVGEVNFNIKCDIERMEHCLSTCITGRCFEVAASVIYLNKEGSKMILDDRNLNTITCKHLLVGQTEELIISINNLGQTGFYFNWKNSEKYLSDVLTLSFVDVEGYVKIDAEACCTIRIVPVRSIKNKSIKLKLAISYGPTYSIKLNCSTLQCLYKFSFEYYNFGCCLVQKEKSYYYCAELQFTNNDKNKLLLEVIFEDTPHCTIQFQSREVLPDKAETIQIYFHPLELGHYEFKIPFFVDSKQHMVILEGESVPLQVEVADPADRCLNMTNVLAGKSKMKRVKVVNLSKAKICIIFDLFERLPYNLRSKKKSLGWRFDQDIEKPTPKTDEKKKKKGGSSKGSKGKKSKSSQKSKSSKKSGSSKKTKGSKNKKSKASGKSKKSKKSKEKGKKKKGKDSKKGKSEEVVEEVETEEMLEQRLIRQFTIVKPKSFCKLPPGSTTEFSIKFAPARRMKTFVQKISYQVQDTVDTICVFKASCIGADFSLDKDIINFGAIIKGCKARSNFALINNGDVGGNFNWIVGKLNRIYYDLTPSEGYITPDTNIVFTVTFTPGDISQCNFETKARCYISGVQKPLELLLNGFATTMPPPKGLVKFSCPVRSTDMKEIQVENPTSETWQVYPSVDNSNYLVPKIISIQAKCSLNCEVVYSPIAMTPPDKYHEATLFLALPHGQGLSYKLAGSALDPLPLGKITREIQCKTNFSVELELTNWLNELQQFKVVSMRMDISKDCKMYYRCLGNKAIELLPKRSRKYLWKIYVLNEGSLKFDVVFQNESSKEFLHYLIELTVKKCSPLDTIRLTTCVRKPIEHKLVVENPLEDPITMNLSCDSNWLTFEKTLLMDACSEEEVVIVFNPLFAGESTCILEVKAPEVGSYPYKFVLNAKPPVLEPLVEFKAFLGNVYHGKIAIRNNNPTTAELNVTLEDSSVFRVHKVVNASAKGKGEIEIAFDPTSIGAERTTMTVVSKVLGEFKYPLFGKCEPPKALGPFTVKLGSFTTIPFRNPYNDVVNFSFTTEPAAFALSVKSAEIKPKQVFDVAISLSSNVEDAALGKYPVTGKLHVTSIDCTCPQILCDTKWTFYLQGTA